MVKISFVYILFFILFYIICALFNKKVRPIIVYSMVFFVILSLAIIAFNTFETTFDKDDLARYFYSMDIYREKGLAYALKEGAWFSSPIATIEMYFFSLLNNNHFLPAFNSIVIYSCYFYIIIDQCFDKSYVNTRKFIFFVLLFFVIIDLYAVISNIRFPLAAALTSMGIYIEYEKKSRISTILYIMAILIHSSLICIIILNLIHKTKLFYKRGYMVVLLVLIVFNYLPKMLMISSNPFLLEIGSKFVIYGGDSIRSLSVIRYIGYILVFFGLYFISNSNKVNKSLLYYYNIQSSFIGIMFMVVDTIAARFLPIHYCVSISDISIDMKHLTLKNFFGILMLIIGAAIIFYYSCINNYITWEFI